MSRGLEIHLQSVQHPEKVGAVAFNLTRDRHGNLMIDFSSEREIEWDGCDATTWLEP